VIDAVDSGDPRRHSTCNGFRAVSLRDPGPSASHRRRAGASLFRRRYSGDHVLRPVSSHPHAVRHDADSDRRLPSRRRRLQPLHHVLFPRASLRVSAYRYREEVRRRLAVRRHRRLQLRAHLLPRLASRTATEQYRRLVQPRPTSPRTVSTQDRRRNISDVCSQLPADDCGLRARHRANVTVRSVLCRRDAHVAVAEHQLGRLRLHERQVRESLPLHFLRGKYINEQSPAKTNISVPDEEDTGVDLSVYCKTWTRTADT